LRKDNTHWSQRELSRELHLTGNSVARFERGYERPNPDMLRRICELVDGDYYELAALGGLIPAPQGETIAVPVRAEIAEYVRRLADLPATVWDRLERMARIAFLEPATPEEPAEGERDDERQLHRPNAEP
jgi:transcriptional regulator with XRE-family HTH domain